MSAIGRRLGFEKYGHGKCTRIMATGEKMKTAALWETFSADHRNAALTALRDIVDGCRDGEHGYGQAAEDVADPRLKELFTIYATQRRNFADAVERYFVSLGGAPRSRE